MQGKATAFRSTETQSITFSKINVALLQ
uniref:Uncharacterized protein n=1 Tax=Anguilla anguilla TaxID=7936 RepID=A0A0E9PNI4_ANGAN